MALDLRISLQKLEVLSLVVQLGGVGRAAEHLVVTQPVVSAHLRSLEERLGTKLFYREGRQLHLTEAGATVYEWAQDLLIRSRQFERDLDGLLDGSRGRIMFGSSMSVGSYRLPDVLAAFRTEHPEVDIRLSISDTEHAIDDTRKGVLDFAVVVTDPNAEIAGMQVERIGHDDIVLVVAPEDDRCTGAIGLDELQALPFVDAPDGIVRRSFVDRQLRRVGVTDRRVVLELGHPEAMKRAVQRGLGVALLFRSAVHDELERGLLREVPVEGVDLVVPISLVHSKGKSLSAVHRNLIGVIRAALGSEDEQRLAAG